MHHSTIKTMETKKFEKTGDWNAHRDALKWLNDNGYDYGSSDACNPTAITIGNYYDTDLPHKWHNFTEKQKKSVVGKITGDIRNGPVFVTLF